ncbi:MAG: UDP-2,3-diacylglucosamine diphosphatase [Bacteroidetes bacterium]|nr:UDP-2,3-diacylglucosamine diphosphatase [Bacteroidota bacterium]
MLHIQPGKRVYFLSDFHLGIPDRPSSLAREHRVIAFLRTAAADAAGIFILGDIFDFWYEYRKVVPKGYVRLLGTLASIADEGIPIHFFVGNHDMWVRDYFQHEIGMQVHYHPIHMDMAGKRFYLGHGDGLGPGDHGYKLLKMVFRNPFCQWAFGMIPPTLGIGLAEHFSRGSRIATGHSEDQFLGESQEWLITHCRKQLQKEHFDYFIFGHRHLPIDYRLEERSRYVNLGDWLRYDSYAVFDGTDLTLHTQGA